MVETGRVTDEVPFADDRGLVSRGLEQFWKCGLRAVEAAVRVVVKTIEMAVFAGQNRGAARSANGIGHEAAIEAYPTFREPIDVRGSIQLPRVVVCADGLIGVVVGKNEHDVGPLLVSGAAGPARAG